MDLCNFRSFQSEIDELRQFRNRRIRKPQKIRNNPMQELTDDEFRLRYRFRKETMNWIIELLGSELQVDTRGGGIPVDLQVMAVIRYWGRHEIQEECADMHGMSQQTLSDIARKVAIVLASKSALFIKMPANASEEANAISKFETISGFQGITGAIDCTHIKIRKDRGEVDQYHVNRKGYCSINTQVVCDADLKICDIVCHWSGSTHDAQIWHESSIRRRFEEGEFVGRLICDSNYPCTPYLITPVLRPSCEEEESFNHQHIRAHNVIERCFIVLKQRFKILLGVMRGSHATIKATIIACAVLHNIAIIHKDETGAAPLDYEVGSGVDSSIIRDDEMALTNQHLYHI